MLPAESATACSPVAPGTVGAIVVGAVNVTPSLVAAAKTFDDASIHVTISLPSERPTIVGTLLPVIGCGPVVTCTGVVNVFPLSVERQMLYATVVSARSSTVYQSKSILPTGSTTMRSRLFCRFFEKSVGTTIGVENVAPPSVDRVK